MGNVAAAPEARARRAQWFPFPRDGLDMRRIFLFGKARRAPAPQAWQLSAEQHRELLDLLSDMGLRVVGEARGPVPLLTFGRRVLERLGSSDDASAARPVPLPDFADALKHVIRDMGHDRLRVLSPTDFLGVGYVYDAGDPETWPVQSSR